MTESYQADNVVSMHDAANIYRRLNNGVVGQDSGKRDLATLLAMHLQWFLQPDITAAHAAPNALIIGPTGVGKTHAIRTAATALRIPLAVADATRLSTSGRGEDSLDGILIELLRAARRLIHSGSGLHDVDEPPELEELNLARRGIVFLDEFDKLAAVQGRSRDDQSELVQRRLLEFVDGAVITLPSGQHTGEEELVFDTAGLLFILAGAFNDLTADPGNRTHASMRGRSRHDHIIPEDIVRSGFMRELVARIPVIIEFSKLSEQDLSQILMNDEVNPAVFYIRYLASLGTVLEISDEARAYIAESAAKLEVGARGLHQVMFPILSLLAQEIENTQARPNKILLDALKVRSLNQEVEERRSVRRRN